MENTLVREDRSNFLQNCSKTLQSTGLDYQDQQREILDTSFQNHDLKLLIELQKQWNQKYINRSKQLIIEFFNELAIQQQGRQQCEDSSENVFQAKLRKIYNEDGSFFIGNFVQGQAEGPCFSVQKDETLFKGSIKEDCFQCDSGFLITKNFQYIGGFRKNKFHGKGQQISSDNNYSFQGTYVNGRKTHGIMKWSTLGDYYVYEGYFDKNQKFTGQGTLTNFYGLYQGQFLNGKKNGVGTFIYTNGIRYEGTYFNGKKQGEGHIFSDVNTLAYTGSFENGMPYGLGVSLTRQGIKYQDRWIQGISVQKFDAQSLRLYADQLKRKQNKWAMSLNFDILW